MAFTEIQYNTLKEAISTGTKKVKYADKEIEYQSLSDMMRVLSIMEAELFPTVTENRRKYVEQGRGF